MQIFYYFSHSHTLVFSFILLHYALMKNSWKSFEFLSFICFYFHSRLFICLKIRLLVLEFCLISAKIKNSCFSWRSIALGKYGEKLLKNFHGKLWIDPFILILRSIFHWASNTFFYYFIGYPFVMFFVILFLYLWINIINILQY